MEARIQQFYLRWKATAIKALKKKLGDEATAVMLKQFCNDPEFSGNITLIKEQATVIEKQTELINQLENSLKLKIDMISELNNDMARVTHTLTIANQGLEDYRVSETEANNKISDLNEKIMHLEAQLLDNKHDIIFKDGTIDETRTELIKTQNMYKAKCEENENLNRMIVDLKNELQQYKPNMTRPQLDVINVDLDPTPNTTQHVANHPIPQPRSHPHTPQYNTNPHVPQPPHITTPHMLSQQTNPYLPTYNTTPYPQQYTTPTFMPPPQNTDNYRDVESKLDNVLTKQLLQNDAKRISPFHGIIGTNGHAKAAEDFLIFYEELMKYQQKHSVDDKSMIIIFGEKTIAEAKDVFKYYKLADYNNFIEALDMFRQRYIKSDIAEYLRNNFAALNRKYDESVEQFNIRVGLTIEKIRDLTGQPPTFMEIEKVLLRPFAEELITFHGIKTACKNKNFNELVNEIEESYRRRPSLLKMTKNKIMSATETEHQMRCIHCNKTNHASKNCFHIKDRKQVTAPITESNRSMVDTSVPPPNFPGNQPFRG